jgi:Flp pilus assembly protein TadD
VRDADQNQVLLSALGEAYGFAGRTADAERVLARLLDLSSREYIAATSIANVYVALDRRSDACDWLERAYEERDPFLCRLGMRTYARLRDEPRYRALMQKLNLPL